MFARLLKHIPFAASLLSIYYCVKDPATPTASKAIFFAALAYFVMPLDLVPDFIALFGFADDAAVLYMAFKHIRRHLQPEHRKKAKMYLEGH